VQRDPDLLQGAGFLQAVRGGVEPAERGLQHPDHRHRQHHQRHFDRSQAAPAALHQ
jgi:hypothetical protein